jgi:V8-like Glu-specific endopeptidase
MRLGRVILAATLFVAGAFGAAAQEVAPSPLKALQTADDTRGWHGVGRLNIGPTGFCTGALIAPDLVLTAGHCLFDKRTGRQYEASEIEFLAGWRDGRAEAYRGARRAIPHPDYDPRSKVIGEIAHDLALIELDRPIRNADIAPFAVVASSADRGDEVGIVSYAKDRAERPSLQEVCHVMARQEGALILSCSVDFGASGAPIFSFRGGKPQIVSVVSAMADMQSQKVSLGTSLAGPLADLRQAMAEGDGVFRRAAPKVTRMSAEQARASGSAKFLRP